MFFEYRSDLYGKIVKASGVHKFKFTNFILEHLVEFDYSTFGKLDKSLKGKLLENYVTLSIVLDLINLICKVLKLNRC